MKKSLIFSLMVTAFFTFILNVNAQNEQIKSFTELYESGEQISTQINSEINIAPNYNKFKNQKGVNAQIYFNDRALFDAAFPSQEIEDFEEARVAPLGVSSSVAPWDKNSNDVVFLPGEIINNLQLNTLPVANNLFVALGVGLLGAGHTSSIVGPNFFADDMEVIFSSSSVNVFGFDLLANNSGLCDIELYDDANNLVDVATINIGTNATFFGVNSDTPIKRIVIASQIGAGELIDNFTFSSAPPVNEPPVVKYNNGLSIDEGGSEIIYSNQLLYKDPEGSTYLKYTLLTPPVHGVLKNDGVVVPAMGTFTQKDIGNWKVTYEHDGSETSTDKFDFEVSDSDRLSAPSDSFEITINLNNDIPVLAMLEDTNLQYILGSSAAQITSTIEATDLDNTELASATIAIGSYVAGEDFLTFTDTPEITHAFDAATGMLTLTGPATTSQFQDALRAVKFTCLGVQSIGTQKTISFSVNDGSDDSVPASRIIDVTLPSGTTAGLNAPTNITIVRSFDGSITVSWQDNAGNEIGYIIYREVQVSNKLGTILVYEQIGVVTADGESFIDDTALEGVVYKYKVAAYNADGTAGGDDQNSVTQTTTLNPPSDLTANEDANENVALNWTDNSGMEEGYKVERSDGSGFVEIADLDAGSTTYTDETVIGGESYSYRVKAYSAAGDSEYSEVADLTITDIGDLEYQIPDEFTLAQNYPNPFNPSTIIRYGLPEASNVRLVVYDLLGQEVAVLVNQIQSSGYHEVTFNADNVNSGIYIYKIEAGSYTEIKKMLLLR